MTASVGGEGKERDKETTPVEDAKPGGVSELMFSSVSDIDCDDIGQARCPLTR